MDIKGQYILKQVYFRPGDDRDRLESQKLFNDMYKDGYEYVESIYSGKSYFVFVFKLIEDKEVRK